MATIEQISKCKEIFDLAMTVSAQGNESVHAQYCANVDSLCVYKTHQPDGWTYNDHWVYLGEGPADGRDPLVALDGLKSELTAMLDVDSDGVPV